MITKKIGFLKLELYNGIDELTTERYHKFNLYCLLSSGVGSDVESIKEHMIKIYQVLQKKDFKRLQKMFENYYLSLSYITEGLDLKTLAFTCLIHSINGDEISDLSDDNLERLSKRITKNIKRQAIFDLFKEIKKKLSRKSKYISRVELARAKQDLIIGSLKNTLNYP